MGSGRTWLRRAAALALAAAGAFGSGAATPVTQGWSADPDDQFLLDVKLRQYRLGDGVRAYNTPEGTCVVFGDFLATLDVPMKIDLTARKASGWAFREGNSISIDAGNGFLTCFASPGKAGRMPDLKPDFFRDGAALYAIGKQHGDALLAQGYGVMLGTAASPGDRHSTWRINYYKEGAKDGGLHIVIDANTGKVEKVLK
jgi:hypothetical protein